MIITKQSRNSRASNWLIKYFAGPKQNTMADFWLMIWQENIEQVVMLTNIMEGNKVNKYHTLSVLVDFIDSNFYYSFTYKCVYI